MSKNKLSPEELFYYRSLCRPCKKCPKSSLLCHIDCFGLIVFIVIYSINNGDIK